MSLQCGGERHSDAVLIGVCALLGSGQFGSLKSSVMTHDGLCKSRLKISTSKRELRTVDAERAIRIETSDATHASACPW